MAIQRAEVVWLEARADYTVHDLVEMSGLPWSILDELIECGALPSTTVTGERSSGGVDLRANDPGVSDRIDAIGSSHQPRTPPASPDERSRTAVGPTADVEQSRFEAESILLARAARRLHDHFELDHEGLAVAVSLLRRVRRLEARLAAAGLN